MMTISAVFVSAPSNGAEVGLLATNPENESVVAPISG
jgi:hypothetical protein